MNLLFHIQPSNIDTTKADLFLEIDAHGLSYIILNKGICVALVMYHFEEAASDEAAEGYIHQIVADEPILQQNFNSVQVIYGYSPSILVPLEFSDDIDNGAMLELVYGEASERVVRTDTMPGYAIQNVYGIPAVIEQVVMRYFGLARFTHFFSLLPAVVKEPADHLYCIFSTGHLKVLLIEDGKLQAMQNYDYSTPEDVAYHLLKICKSFDVDVNEITVRLSGMIEMNSALYIELYKYFLQLQFEPLPGQYQYPSEINQYPSHYFSHLFAIAACV